MLLLFYSAQQKTEENRLVASALFGWVESTDDRKSIAVPWGRAALT
jgi:hypothetical protein